jgi:hypothetical protein
MSDKQEKIKKLLEMQRKFIDYEHEHGVSAHDYYAAPQDHPLYNYREDYWNVADEICNIAHSEKGSKRD